MGSKRLPRVQETLKFGTLVQLLASN